MKKKFAVSFLLFLCASVAFAQGQNTCGGLYGVPVFTSNGNPYPCSSACTNDANCTWWAWYQTQAQTAIWPEPLPHLVGDAGSVWVTDAQAAHWGTTTTPTVGSIAVNYSPGHVAYVQAVNGSTVTVSEMNCDYPAESYRNPTDYPASFFSYYITPRPKVNSIWPSPPTHSSSNQTLYTYGGAFEPGMTVLVTFPSGGTGTLSGTQITRVSSTQVNLTVTLNATGTWSFVYKNPDGGWSAPFYFTVN